MYTHIFSFPLHSQFSMKRAIKVSLTLVPFITIGETQAGRIDVALVTHLCNLLSGSTSPTNNCSYSRQDFPSATTWYRSPSHGSAFRPRISEECSDSWPKRAPATNDLWVRKNNRRSTIDRTVDSRISLHLRFRKASWHLSQRLSLIRWLLLDGSPCNVSHWKRSLRS